MAQVEDMVKYHKAAQIKAEFMWPNLFQLIGQRQVYAMNILRCNNDDVERFKQVYDFCDEQIKELLALK